MFHLFFHFGCLWCVLFVRYLCADCIAPAPVCSCGQYTRMALLSLLLLVSKCFLKGRTWCSPPLIGRLFYHIFTSKNDTVKNVYFLNRDPLKNRAHTYAEMLLKHVPFWPALSRMLLLCVCTSRVCFFWRALRPCGLQLWSYFSYWWVWASNRITLLYVL